MKQEVIKKYQDYELGGDPTHDGLSITYEKFLNEEELIDFLYDLNVETRLTKKGYDFLVEYYGLETIADLVLKNQTDDFNFGLSQKSDIESWLGAGVEPSMNLGGYEGFVLVKFKEDPGYGFNENKFGEDKWIAWVFERLGTELEMTKKGWEYFKEKLGVESIDQAKEWLKQNSEQYNNPIQ